MAETRLSTLRALWAPKLVRIALLLVATVAGYDSFSSQFGFPTLGRLLGVSGSLLPWWGWLLVVQGVFVYALFEYVRRAVAPTADPSSGDEAASTEVLILALKAKLNSLSENQKAFSEFEEKAMKNVGVANDISRLLSDRIEQIDSKVSKGHQHFGEVEGKMLEAVKRLEAQQSVSEQFMRRQVASLRQALTAIFHREQLQTLATEVEARAAELITPTTHGACYEDADQWEAWIEKFFAWRGVVQQWVDIAEAYSPHTDIQVFDVHPDQLQEKGVAKVDQFPDPEAFIAYKGFWILLKQWRERREQVEQAVQQAAFEGATTEEKPVILGDGMSGKGLFPK
ncbi:MAG: hypothetical protein QOJ27_739 [Sphingomonadales bacterium]|nr:hypothetical protein [Sphingomonadales bacterium]